MGATARVDGRSREVFCAAHLEKVFNDCFTETLRTRLAGGAQEPLYQPAQAVDSCALLYYREDFFASALHEVAHWCIAGTARRQRVDFGYWYAPQGRSPQQQRAFEAVETKPQALEWYFSQACGYRFRVSVDNLDGATGELPDTMPFQRRVLEQALVWQRAGLPPRAQAFYLGLCREFNTGCAPQDLHLTLADLD